MVDSPNAPGTSVLATTAGATVAEKIDALHVKHLAGSTLGQHTDLWNAVFAFKEEVKALVAAIETDVEKALGGPETEIPTTKA